MERLLALREREGLTYREAARRGGVSAGSLAWWSWRLRQPHQVSAPRRRAAFVEVEVVEDGVKVEDAGLEILVGAQLIALERDRLDARSRVAQCNFDPPQPQRAAPRRSLRPPGTALGHPLGAVAFVHDLHHREAVDLISLATSKQVFMSNDVKACRSRRLGGWFRLSVCGAWFLYLSLYTGFFFHRSHDPSVLGYSWNYMLFLGITGFPLLIPPALLWGYTRLGSRPLLFAPTTAVTLVASSYLIAAETYYQTRHHPFDPFLQISDSAWKVTPRDNPATLRVLAVGGSTTRCGNLRENERYPAQLERLLREALPGSDVEVINAGVDWWTTKHSLLAYVSDTRRWKADVVVIMHALNDACRSFSPAEFSIGAYNEHWSHFYGPSINGANPPSFESWVLKRPLDVWFSSLRLRPVNFPLETFRSLPRFADHLSTLVRYIQSDGAKVVLVTEPSLYKEVMSVQEQDVLWIASSLFVTRQSYFKQHYADAASLARAMNAYNAVTEESAREERTALVRAAEAMSRDLAHFVDDVHYTPLGALRLAELVAPAVLRALSPDGSTRIEGTGVGR